MARPRKFDDDGILDAVIRIAASQGPAAATVKSISDLSGAPTGSMYHRFPSRGYMLAAAWLRSAQRAEIGFLAALDHPEPLAAAIRAANATFDFADAHPLEGLVLARHRAEEFGAEWPADLASSLTAHRARIDGALRGLAARLHDRDPDAALRGRVHFALLDMPAAAIGRHLTPPSPLDPAVRALAVESIAALLSPPAERERPISAAGTDTVNTGPAA